MTRPPEPVNHAAEARRLIAAVEQVMGEHAETHPDTQMSAAEAAANLYALAQVHATLALVDAVRDPTRVRQTRWPGP